MRCALNLITIQQEEEEAVLLEERCGCGNE
jgi:hypothetical protein